MARDVEALPGAVPAPEDSAAGDAHVAGRVASRLTGARTGRKRLGPGRRILRVLGSLVAVLLVLLTIAAIGGYQLLEQGPVSLQPLVPWLKAPIEQRLGRPVDIRGLQLRWAGEEENGLVLDAGPVVIGGEAPARVETMQLRVGLPFRLQAGELRIVDADALTLLAAWPTHLAPELRTRLVALIGGGHIRTGELDYRFGGEEAEDLTVRIMAEDALVRLPDGLPEISGPEATVTVEDGLLRISAPKVSGADLLGSSIDVTIDHLFEDLPSVLHLSGDVEGPARALYRLLADPPLALVPSDLVDVAGLRGQTSGHLALALPLADDTPPEAIGVEAEGRFQDVSGRLHLPLPIELAKGRGRFSVKDGAIHIDAKAELFDAPVALALHDRWKGVDEGRRLELQGPVDRKLLEHFGLAAPEQFDGKAEVVARLHESPEGAWQADLTADLKETAVEEKLSGFTKQPGEPGQLKVAGQVAPDGGWSIGQFKLTAGSQKAAGSLMPDKAGYLLKLDQVLTSAMDLSARLRFEAGQGIQGQITARRARLPGHAAMPQATSDDAELPIPLGLVLAIDRLELESDALENVNGHVRRSEQGFTDVRLAFDLDGKGSLTIAPGTLKGRQRLELHAPNAGRLVQALGAGDAISGGQLKIEADISRQVPHVEASGRLDLGRTRIGMGGKEPLPFEKIVLPFQIDGPKVTIDQARMTGGVVGIRVSGTLDRRSRALAMSGQVTPLYPLNRFIGQIPIVGAILGGFSGMGAINMDFTLSGTLDDPKAKLAAGSVLVPGVVRDLLGAIKPR